MRLRLLIPLIAVLAIGPTVSAGAQAATDYPPSPAACDIGNGRVVTAGADAFLSCAGLFANRLYGVGFSQSPEVSLGSARTDANGNLSTTIRIPASAKAGAATLILRSGTDVHRFAITVDRAGVSGALLPKTGAQIERMVMWAVALLLLGTVLVTLARRRRSKVPASS